MLVGASGKIINSSDGTSWETISPSTVTTGSIFGIARGGTTWVVAGASGYISSISDSEDDLTTRTSGTTASLRRVYYVSGD